MARDATYDAFISYNHAADGQLAVALKRDLQRFAKKWYARRAMRVFLDRESLEATASLGDALDDKLRGARYLILLASRESAQSPWCDHEAQFWLRERGPDSLLLVLTDAESDVRWDWDNDRFDPEASTALPPALIDGYPEQPLYTDLRWIERDAAVSRLNLRNPQYRRSVAQLAATIRDEDVDRLDGEDLRQHRRATRIRTAAIVVLAALTITSGVLFVQARRERDRAEVETAAAIAQQAQAVARDDPGVALVLAAEAAARSSDWRTEHALIAVGIERGGLSAVARGHTAKINSVAMSEAGGFVVTGSSDRTARIVDLATGELRHRLDADGLVLGVAADPAGGWVLTADDSGAVIVWDATTGDERRRLAEPGAAPGTAWDVAVDATGRRVAAGSGDGTARVWSVDDGELVGAFRHGGGVLGVVGVAFDPSGPRLASLGGDDRVLLWDLDSGDPVEVAAVSTTNRYDLAISPDGSQLATAEFDGSIRLWDTATGAADGELAGHSGIVWAVSYTDDGARLVSGGFDRTVRVWDLAAAKGLAGAVTGEVARFRSGASAGVEDVAVSPSGTFIVGSDDRRANVWDVSCTAAVDDSATLVAAAGGRLATAGFRGDVRVWDVAGPPEAGQCGVPVAVVDIEVATPTFAPTDLEDAIADGFDEFARSLPDDLALITPVRDLSLSADGRVVAAATSAGAVVHDLSSGASTVVARTDEGRALDLGADGSVVALATGPGSLSVVDLSVVDEPRWEIELAPPVAAVRLSPDESLVAAVSADGEDGALVSVFDAATGDAVAPPTPLTGPVDVDAVTIEFVPDGLVIATPSDVVLLDAARGWEQAVELVGAPSRVVDVGVAPDGAFLAALDENGQVTLWSTAERRAITTFDASLGEDVSVGIEVLDDGGRLATLGSSAAVQLWPPLLRTVEDACTAAAPLTTRRAVTAALPGVSLVACAEL